jgi:hypothetical protein
MHVFINVVLGHHPRVALHLPDCTHPTTFQLGPFVVSGRASHISAVARLQRTRHPSL